MTKKLIRAVVARLSMGIAQALDELGEHSVRCGALLRGGPRDRLILLIAERDDMPHSASLFLSRTVAHILACRANPGDRPGDGVAGRATTDTHRIAPSLH